MQIGTTRTTTGTQAFVQGADYAIPIDGYDDVGDLLRAPAWEDEISRALASDQRVESFELVAPITNPGKIICVGANYREHIREMGSSFPECPTLFAKFPEALIGPVDDIELPDEDKQIDWEAELAIVIGKEGRRISKSNALSHVAGYTVLNDISMRAYQFRTAQWLQGKTWERSTPFGPAITLADYFDLSDASITCSVNGEVKQQSNISDLLFGVEEIITYISTIVTLRPGDIIATGTPSGVGIASHPQQFLTSGDEVVTTIEGIGSLCNRIC